MQTHLPARAPVEPEQIKGTRIVTPAPGATKWGWLINVASNWSVPVIIVRWRGRRSSYSAASGQYSTSADLRENSGGQCAIVGLHRDCAVRSEAVASASERQPFDSHDGFRHLRVLLSRIGENLAQVHSPECSSG